MKIARATKEGGEHDSRGAIEPESGRREIVRSDVVARARTDRVLLVAEPGQQQRLAKLIGSGYQVECATTAAHAVQLLEASRFDFVLAGAGACSEQLLAAVSMRGLSRACVFLAEPEGIERLVRAYAAQHAFRVLSHDVGAVELQSLIHNALYPRGTERHSLPGIAVELQTHDGRTLVCDLLDLSNRGLAVRMDPRDGLLLPNTEVAEVRLARGDDVLLCGVGAVVRYVEVLAAGSSIALAYKVGLEFQKPLAPPRPAAERVIAEPIRIRALVAEGLRRSTLEARVPNTGQVLASGPASLASDGRTIRFEPGACLEAETGDVLEARFEFAGSGYSFLTSVTQIGLDPTAPTLELRAPKSLRAVRQRKAVRFRPDASSPISVTPVSPFSGPLGRRPAVNITGTGAAFELASGADLLPIGTRLGHLLVHLPDGHTLSCRAVVRSLTADGSSAGAPDLCGVEFQDLTSSERTRIADTIAHAGQTDVRDGAGTRFEDLWKFFIDARFLYPEKLATIDVPSVRDTVTALLSRPNELLRTTLVVGEEGILAHVSAVRAYQRTWILQHLAALPGERATIGRGRIMNLAIIQYLEQLPDIEWAKIWFRPQSPWPARVFGRFARRVEDPRRSCLRTYTYMTAGPGDLPDSPGPATLTIRAAAADDLAAVEAYFVRHGSAVLQAADDLTRDALTLEPVRAAYAELDLDRRREVLVAERRGRLVGFALLEMSSKGLNFSELTNTFRIFAEHADPEVSTELARAARARYASSGRSHCFGLAAEGEVAAFEAAGFTGSRQYACWTWHRSLYLDFCEHVLRLRV